MLTQLQIFTIKYFKQFLVYKVLISKKNNCLPEFKTGRKMKKIKITNIIDALSNF